MNLKKKKRKTLTSLWIAGHVGRLRGNEIANARTRHGQNNTKHICR